MRYLGLIVIFFGALQLAAGGRCYVCRSRGELGSCKDPFTFNATDVQDEPGLSAIPCASGWCGKVIEGGGAYAVDDYDQAVQRMCVQRGPDDNEERCAHTVFNYKKVYMCFCHSDLCNGATATRQPALTPLTMLAIAACCVATLLTTSTTTATAAAKRAVHWH